MVSDGTSSFMRLQHVSDIHDLLKLLTSALIVCVCVCVWVLVWCSNSSCFFPSGCWISPSSFLSHSFILYDSFLSSFPLVDMHYLRSHTYTHIPWTSWCLFFGVSCVSDCSPPQGLDWFLHQAVAARSEEVNVFIWNFKIQMWMEACPGSPSLALPNHARWQVLFFPLFTLLSLISVRSRIPEGLWPLTLWRSYGTQRSPPRVSHWLLLLMETQSRSVEQLATPPAGTSGWCSPSCDAGVVFPSAVPVTFEEASVRHPSCSAAVPLTFASVLLGWKLP